MPEYAKEGVGPYSPREQERILKTLKLSSASLAEASFSGRRLRDDLAQLRPDHLVRLGRHIESILVRRGSTPAAHRREAGLVVGEHLSLLQREEARELLYACFQNACQHGDRSAQLQAKFMLCDEYSTDGRYAHAVIYCYEECFRELDRFLTEGGHLKRKRHSMFDYFSMARGDAELARALCVVHFFPHADRFLGLMLEHNHQDQIGRWVPWLEHRITPLVRDLAQAQAWFAELNRTMARVRAATNPAMLRGRGNAIAAVIQDAEEAQVEGRYADAEQTFALLSRSMGGPNPEFFFPAPAEREIFMSMMNKRLRNLFCWASEIGLNGKPARELQALGQPLMLRLRDLMSEFDHTLSQEAGQRFRETYYGPVGSWLLGLL